MMILTPNGFLKVGGIVLLLLGILGFVLPGGVLIPDKFILTMGENLAHVVLGIVALIAAYVLPASSQRGLVVAVGILALVFAVWGFMVRDMPFQNFYDVANLENPLDNLLHLVVGIWAIWAAMKKNSAAVAM